jgi:hypothetical protein
MCKIPINPHWHVVKKEVIIISCGYNKLYFAFLQLQDCVNMALVNKTFIKKSRGVHIFTSTSVNMMKGSPLLSHL